MLVCKSGFSRYKKCMTQRQHRLCLGALLVVAFTLRIGYCSVTSGLGEMRPSYREYVTAGQRLLTRHTLESPLVPLSIASKPSALMPPLYAGIVATIYGLTGIESYWSILILKSVNILASTMTVWLVFMIMLRITAQPTYSWIAAIVVTINPAMIGFTDFIWDTNLFAFAATLTIWFAIHLSNQPFTWTRWSGYGFWLGGLALLNPALTMAYPLLVLWPLHRSGRLQPRVVCRAVTFCVCGWLIAIAPWTIRNYIQFDKVMYIRSGLGLEFWLGACPEADTNGAEVYNAQYPLNNQSIQAHVSQVGENHFIAECGKRASDAIKRDPIRYTRLVAIRTLDFWLGSAFSHAKPGQWGWPRSMARGAISLFLSAEMFLICWCILLTRKVNIDLLWLVGMALSFSAIYCLTHIQVRYRAPIEPMMAVILAMAIAQVFAPKANQNSQVGQAIA